MKRKLALLLAIVMATTLVFGGCTQSKDTKDTVKDDTKVSDNKKGATEENKESNFNEKGFPIVNEPVTLKVLGLIQEGSSEINPVLYQDLEKKTNVKIEWDAVIDTAWKEKKGLLFASGDLPDVFMGAGVLKDGDLLKYGSQGMLVDIKDYVDKYSEYLKEVFGQHPEIQSACVTPDGQIFGAPSFDRGFPITTSSPMYINKDWLDKLGLKVPTTTDEFKNVLKAFKEKDPNGNNKKDEIPLTFIGNISNLFGAFGVVDNFENHIAVKDGKVIYTATTPEYKEAIKYFNGLFAEGLIDPEAFTQDGSVFGGKAKGEERILGVLQSWRSTGWKRNPDDPDDYIAISPLKGPNGDQLWPKMSSSVGRAGAAITSQCKNPEVAFRWIDAFYEPDFAVQVSLLYYMGVHMEKTDEDKLNIIKKPIRGDEEDNKYFPWNGHRIFNMTKSNGDRFIQKPAHIIEKQTLDKLYNSYYPEESYPDVFFNEDDNKRLSQLSADINTYANECYARWMMEGGVDSEWEGYVKELKAMGLDEYIKLYQDAYNRFKN